MVPINLTILFGLVILTFVMLNSHTSEGAAIAGYSIDIASKRSAARSLVRDRRIYELIVKKRNILKVLFFFQEFFFSILSISYTSFHFSFGREKLFCVMELILDL